MFEESNKKSILIFNKVPLEKALNKNDVEKWINNATIKADRNNISGKELTPFLINEINLGKALVYTSHINSNIDSKILNLK